MVGPLPDAAPRPRRGSRRRPRPDASGGSRPRIPRSRRSTPWRPCRPNRPWSRLSRPWRGSRCSGRSRNPTSPSRRPCRPRTARPSRLRRCLPGLRRRPPRRCRRSGLRPMSPWRRAGPASFAFRYCSWNPMFRLLSEIHLQMFTPLPVGSDRRTNPVRTLHMPGRRQTSISDSFPSATCYATRFRACRVGHFPGRLRIRKRDPEGSLEKKSHLNQW